MLPLLAMSNSMTPQRIKVRGSDVKSKNNSVGPTLDVLHSLLWDGAWEEYKKEIK